MRAADSLAFAHLRRWLPAYGAVLGLWLAARLVLAVAAAGSLYLLPLPTSPQALRLQPDLVGFHQVVEWLAEPRDLAFFWLEPLWRWDAFVYLSIAEHGYQAGTVLSTVFPPLYPLLVRVLQLVLPGQWLLAGLLAAAVATVVALCLLQQLCRLEFCRRADLAPLLLLAFPTAYYLAAPYAEALFLALTLGALLAARAGHWYLAAGLALAASLTKSQGPALVVPLGILAFQAYRTNHRVNPSSLVAFVAPLAGTWLLDAYGRFWLGDVGLLAQQITRWGWQPVVPGWPMVEQARRLATVGVEYAADLFDLPLLLAGLAWLAWGWRRLPPYLAWYGLAVLAPGLSGLRFPPLAANTRFLLLSFPIVIAMALWCDRPWRRVLVLVTSLSLQVVLLVLFVHWGWVA